MWFGRNLAPLRENQHTYTINSGTNWIYFNESHLKVDYNIRFRNEIRIRVFKADGLLDPVYCQIRINNAGQNIYTTMGPLFYGQPLKCRPPFAHRAGMEVEMVLYADSPFTAIMPPDSPPDSE